MIHHLLAKGLATLVIGGGAYKAWQWYQGRNVAPVPPGPSPVPTPQPGPPAPSPAPVDPGTITGPQPGDTNGLVTSAGSSDTSSGVGITVDPSDNSEAVVNPPGVDPNNPTGDTSTSGSDSELVAIMSDASGALGVLGAFGV